MRKELRTQETGGVVERAMSLSREERMMSSAQCRVGPKLGARTTRSLAQEGMQSWRSTGGRGLRGRGVSSGDL